MKSETLCVWINVDQSPRSHLPYFLRFTETAGGLKAKNWNDE